MLRLLCFTAHPDDEAGGFGGTLLRYAELGVATHVICLTSGQAATHRGSAQSDGELSALRRREFHAACKVLKVHRGEVLEYPDGQLDRQDFQTVVADLTRWVREIRPHVIMCLGTEGAITAHPDHSMVALFATMAYHWAGRTNRFTDQLQNGLAPHRTQKLYYATALFTIPDRQPVSLAPSTTVIRLGPREIDAKIAAFKSHSTQAPLFAFFEEMIGRRANMEVFHLANSITPRHAEAETDLFAGVEDTG
jgi:LmbE family N-acetylglucosaminyl deacetylase